MDSNEIKRDTAPKAEESPEKKAETSLTDKMDGALKFKVVESYKALRVNIMFSIIKKGCKSFVVSSSMPGEGKSTIAVNTAIALSQMDARVLLIDSDLRRPKVNRFFGLQSTPGLSNYLIGMNTIDEVLHSTPYPNLKVFCAGSRVPNPSELLASAQM
ncbi:MAG: CpsD/CapB family tyrosine-protein kinase, partial [Clostridia bacterium]|nr:CpsD/CapB family tyrosine-protein kinase [Clostridia bacterium]